MIARAPQRTVYLLRLTALPNVDEIKALRWTLKGLLRRCGLRCISIEAETTAPKGDENAGRTHDQAQAGDR
jgi:hypothetical protein